MKEGIPTYSNQDEKKRFFSLKIINSDNDFYEFMSSSFIKFHSGQGVWRGLPESRYKLYNSLQRKNLITKELNSAEDVYNYIISSTEELSSWNKRLVPKYFLNYGIKNVHVYAKLSILQHNGCETPLIDWTRNPYKALFFATVQKLGSTSEIIKFLKKRFHFPLNGKFKTDRIDNYFSIYFLNKEHPYYKLNSKTIYEVPILDKTFDNDNFWQYVNTGEYLHGEILTSPIQRIDDLPDDSINHYTKSNYNITAQSGLFVLNVDPFKPLEEAILDRIHSPIINRNEDDPIDEWEKRNRDNLICFDIHKKFIPRILDALNSIEVNITEETMYPDFRKLKDEITFEKIAKNFR